ncbi:MAG: hypothetical protein WKG00_09975 [Polyangiaceae bacterium]
MVKENLRFTRTKIADLVHDLWTDRGAKQVGLRWTKRAVWTHDEQTCFAVAVPPASRNGWVTIVESTEYSAGFDAALLDRLAKQATTWISMSEVTWWQRPLLAQDGLVDALDPSSQVLQLSRAEQLVLRPRVVGIEGSRRGPIGDAVLERSARFTKNDAPAFARDDLQDEDPARNAPEPELDLRGVDGERERDLHAVARDDQSP